MTNMLETQMHVNAILPSTLFILTEIVHTFKTSYGIETYKAYLEQQGAKRNLNAPLKRPKKAVTLLVVLLIAAYTVAVCGAPL